MQTQPIQLPTLETCVKLQEAGLLPPKSDILQAPNICHAWVKDFDFDSFYPSSGVFNDEFEFSTIKGGFYEDVIFAPTADQLLPIVKRTVFDVNIAVGGLFWNEKYGYDFNWCPKVRPNQNLAQYLAEVLIFLLSKS